MVRYIYIYQHVDLETKQNELDRRTDGNSEMIDGWIYFCFKA